ncbi:hypothetical protein D5086_018885 [Populus alba]|uniref:Uncharacterized protein n=1 Tax=Populus alba TaxID=43335 RepID=A0ACC4BRM3_POPAL
MASIPSCVLGFSSHGLPTSSFNESFIRLFGNDHVIFLDDERESVQISLDQSSGSGFASQLTYLYSYFSASIKLPGNYTAGVVVSYYTSNADDTWIVYYVDDVPVRVVQKIDAMGGDFPSKAMTLFATIWDGSNWATGGGRDKVDYKYAPFTAKYSSFVLYGCSANPAREDSAAEMCGNATDLNSFNGLTAERKGRLEKFRIEHLTYSYCDDRSRYPTPLPECNLKGKSSRSIYRL